MFSKPNLYSTSFGAKAGLATAFILSGAYLNSVNRDQIDTQESNFANTNEDGTASWTLTGSHTTLSILWIIMLAVITYVWHQLAQSFSREQMSVVNLVFLGLYVLLFGIQISYFQGEVHTSKYLLGVATVVSLVGTAYSFSNGRRDAAIAMGVFTAWLAYRTAALAAATATVDA